MQSLLSTLLIKEHDVILDAGTLICTNRGLWISEPIEYEHNINHLLEFFSVYADTFHHQKEEEILFPAIAKKNEMAGVAVVSELLEHHENFRHLANQIRKALDNKEFTEVQELLESYISLLKDHIAVENDELFPMADDIFNPDELEKLYHKCIDKDTETGITLKEEWKNQIIKLKLNEPDRPNIVKVQ